MTDFKNYKETQVTNAVSIAFTMTVIGKLILEKYKIKLHCSNIGVIDLKTVFRTQKCAEILLNNINLDHDEFLSSPPFRSIIFVKILTTQLKKPKYYFVKMSKNSFFKLEPDSPALGGGVYYALVYDSKLSPPLFLF